MTVCLNVPDRGVQAFASVWKDSVTSPLFQLTLVTTSLVIFCQCIYLALCIIRDFFRPQHCCEAVNYSVQYVSPPFFFFFPQLLRLTIWYKASLFTTHTTGYSWLSLLQFVSRAPSSNEDFAVHTTGVSTSVCWGSSGRECLLADNEKHLNPERHRLSPGPTGDQQCDSAFSGFVPWPQALTRFFWQGSHLLHEDHVERMQSRGCGTSPVDRGRLLLATLLLVPPSPMDSFPPLHSTTRELQRVKTVRSEQPGLCQCKTTCRRGLSPVKPHHVGTTTLVAWASSQAAWALQNNPAKWPAGKSAPPAPALVPLLRLLLYPAPGCCTWWIAPGPGTPQQTPAVMQRTACTHSLFFKTRLKCLPLPSRWIFPKLGKTIIYSQFSLVINPLIPFIPAMNLNPKCEPPLFCPTMYNCLQGFHDAAAKMLPSLSADSLFLIKSSFQTNASL